MYINVVQTGCVFFFKTHGNQTRHKCFHCKRCFASKHGLHGHISHCWKGLGNFKELLKQQRARPTNASPKKKKAPALKPRDRVSWFRKSFHLKVFRYLLKFTKF